MSGVDVAKKKTLILEGNIGAGKSTFLKILGESLDFEIIFEPTDKWQKIGKDGNLLDLFYKDTPRWAYTFQSYAFISRLQAQYEPKLFQSTKGIQILERSVYCDRFCFAKNCFEAGLMSDLEWEIYKEWFTWLVEKFVPKPSGFIYLRTSPEVCYQRLLKRSRSEEASVPLSYLASLHKKHEDWLIAQEEILDSVRDIPVLAVDCDPDFEHDTLQQEKIVSLVENFVNGLDSPTCLPMCTYSFSNSHI